MAAADRPFSAVLHDIVGNIQDIVRSEVRLARTELTEEAAKARFALAVFGVGLVMACLCVFFALLAVVYALSQVMPGWAAALIVAGAVGAIAALLFGVGIAKFKAMRAAPKTVASVKENVKWVKQLGK